MPSFIIKLLALMLTVGLAVPAAPGQEKGDPVDDLEQLIQRLRRVDRRVWDARTQQLERRRTGHLERAAALRKQAAELLERAGREEKSARGLAEEIKRQAEFMLLVGKLGPPPAAAAASKAAAQPSAKEMAKAPPKASAKAEPTAEAAMTPPATAAARPRLLNFRDDVLPIFEAACVICHEPDGADGGLDLSSFATTMRGGSSGEVIKPGDAQASRLFRLVAHLESPKMPKDQGKLPDEEVAAIRDWIDHGAHPDARTALAAQKKAAKEDDGEKLDADETRLDLSDGPMPDSVPSLSLRKSRHAPPGRAIATSPTAPLLAAPGLEQVLLYHTETGELLAVLPFAFGDVEVLRFSRDGERLLAAGGRAGESGGAVLFSIRDGRVVTRIEHRRGSVLAAAVSPLQTLLAIGGADARVHVFHTETGELAHRVDAHDEWILALDFSPDGNYLAAGDRAGRLYVYEADTGRMAYSFEGHDGAIQAVRFRPDAQELASAGQDGTVRLWNLKTGQARRQAAAHTGAALALAWSRRHRLATTGRDGRVRIFDQDARSPRELAQLDDWVYSLAFDASATHLYAGAWNGIIHAFDVASGRRLPPLGSPSD